MDKKPLIKFLIESNEKGYASEDESTWKKEKDHSTAISYKKGNWRLHDNFFGGEPYGGRQVVFYKNKPVWIAVYYGRVDQKIEKIKEVYSFLKKAILKSRKNFPLRGAEKFVLDNFEYRSKLIGDIGNFFLKENIFLNGKVIYEAIFCGGYVDHQSEE